MIWNCGRFALPMGGRTYIMGILNATPDSFSGDGLGLNPQAAVQRAWQMIEEGADILDIGGESTRPGADFVEADEEMRRVLPLIEALQNCGVPLSIDTSKAAVARAALEAGASIVNDVSGATFDSQMLGVMAASDCGCVLMHLRGTPERAAGGRKSEAGDVIAEVLEFWRARVEAAKLVGIARERIVLDAGFGFGKTVEENLQLIKRGRELAAFGLPTLSGTSRKSTLGKILGAAPVEERLFGTAASVALSIANGCDIVRVHDVRAMAQVARVADAIVR